jgi:hypothetical protein
MTTSPPHSTCITALASQHLHHSTCIGIRKRGARGLAFAYLELKVGALQRQGRALDT